MRRHFGFFPVPATLLPALLAAAAMAGLLWRSRDAPLPVLLAAGAAVYGAILWVDQPGEPARCVTGLRA